MDDTRRHLYETRPDYASPAEHLLRNAWVQIQASERDHYCRPALLVISIHGFRELQRYGALGPYGSPVNYEHPREDHPAERLTLYGIPTVVNSLGPDGDRATEVRAYWNAP